jgi:hypothetical protein
MALGSKRTSIGMLMDECEIIVVKEKENALIWLLAE